MLLQVVVTNRQQVGDLRLRGIDTLVKFIDELFKDRIFKQIFFRK